MDLNRTTSPVHHAMLERVLKSLSVRLSDLGMNFSVRNDAGQVVGGSEPACEFCRTVCGACETCSTTAAEAADNVLRGKTPQQMTAETGCSVVALPIRRRRRMIGSAVACFPVRAMLDEEHLARMCDRLQLDRTVTAGFAREACSRTVISPDQAVCLLEHMLDTELACQTSAQELVNLSANLAATYEELSLVYRISGSMQVTQDPQAYVQNVCDELIEVMGVKAAVAIIYDAGFEDDRDMILTAGDCGLSDDQLVLLADKYLVPRFGDENRGVVDNGFSHAESGWPADVVGRLVAVPLVADGPASGVLIGIDKLDDEFNSIDLKLLRSIGSQSAVFLANSRLYGDLEDLLMGVLHALTATIDAKDPYTCGHSRRVSLISRRLAEKCEFEPQHIERIYLVGLLHDIGKIGVPEATLCKKGKLTEEEYTQMKSHPMLGAKILGGIKQLDEVTPGILCHHERPDGRGYPRGLDGNGLPIDGLIVGLADSFDAMTSDRTYRKALPLETVRNEIAANSGTQFAPALVDEFLSWDLEALLAELHRPAELVVPLDASGSSTR